MFAVLDDLLLVRCGQASNFAVQNRQFQLPKRSQVFIRAHNVTFPVTIASAIQIVRPLKSTVDRNRAGSRFLFRAEFLESGIATQRVPLRMEP